MENPKNVKRKNKRKGTELHIRLEQREKKRLEKKARQMDLSLSEYIRMLLSGDSKKRQSPELVNRCSVLCQDILNVVKEKYSCEENSLLEEKVKELWRLL